MWELSDPDTGVQCLCGVLPRDKVKCYWEVGATEREQLVYFDRNDARLGRRNRSVLK